MFNSIFFGQNTSIRSYSYGDIRPIVVKIQRQLNAEWCFVNMLQYDCQIVNICIVSPKLRVGNIAKNLSDSTQDSYFFDMYILV